jgi:hypothetical protein
MAVVLFKLIVPADSVSPPENVFTPLRVNAPAPSLDQAFEPTIAALMMAVSVAFVTAIDADVPVKESVFAAVPPLSIV